MRNTDNHNIEKLTITCVDDVKLSATLYHAPKKVKAAVMICPATGIKQTFYTKFATWLAAQGYSTITFDNRSIGASLVDDINKTSASLIDWGTLDMPAVLEVLKQKLPGHSYHAIGHSAGGQLLGLMSNAFDLKSAFNFACSSGNLSNMDFPFTIQAHFFMNIFIPLNNLIFGHTKSQWLGMGEPLPKNAAQQWQRWCNGEGYVKTDFGKAIQTHHYDALTLDIKWVYATDDKIANQTNVREMQTVFSKSVAEVQAVEPQEYQLHEIGHMGFFKRESLWPLASSWLTEHA